APASEAPPETAFSASSFASDSEGTVATEPEMAVREDAVQADVVEARPAPTAPAVEPAPVWKEPERSNERAYNDPREVRRREREAQLRKEGVLKSDGG